MKTSSRAWAGPVLLAAVLVVVIGLGMVPAISNKPMNPLVWGSLGLAFTVWSLYILFAQRGPVQIPSEDVTGSPWHRPAE
jgi:hypothetical protein